MYCAALYFSAKKLFEDNRSLAIDKGIVFPVSLYNQTIQMDHIANSREGFLSTAYCHKYATFWVILWFGD